MITRYTRPEMAAIWAPENKFKIWLELETCACEAQAELGVIPADVPAIVREKGAFDIARIDAIEAEVKHDVIAFLTNLAEYVGPAARFVHQGMTSSDVVDSTLAVQLTQSADLLMIGLDKVCDALKRRALEHKHTICIGRSHGIHAEPTTFGLKLLGHYAAFDRHRARLKNARAEIATLTISGAVGNYATIDPFVESYVAEKMGLQPEPIATQVIPRDRHAVFVSCMAVIASSIENLAIEIRHLQRSEVREAEEFFSEGQKGSSAMPHKRNPILSENITGLARVVRSAIIPALENVALWHERDISHSAVERTILPDALIALDFALHRLAGIMDKLLVYPKRMMQNFESLGGLHASQRVLLALTQAGISREDAYQLVQKNAMRVWQGEGTLQNLLQADAQVAAAIPADQLAALFDVLAYTKHIETIFNRVLG